MLCSAVARGLPGDIYSWSRRVTWQPVDEGRRRCPSELAPSFGRVVDRRLGWRCARRTWTGAVERRYHSSPLDARAHATRRATGSAGRRPVACAPAPRTPTSRTTSRIGSSDVADDVVRLPGRRARRSPASSMAVDCVVDVRVRQVVAAAAHQQPGRPDGDDAGFERSLVPVEDAEPQDHQLEILGGRRLVSCDVLGCNLRPQVVVPAAGVAVQRGWLRSRRRRTGWRRRRSPSWRG